MKIQWIELQNKGDHRGALLIAEAQKNIPFDIKRVYCLYDMDRTPRGFHAHRNLKQVIICLRGSCQFTLDNVYTRKTFILKKGHTGFILENMIWREMDCFSHDCILMVLASDLYNEADYIRNYDEFKNEIQKLHQNNKLKNKALFCDLIE